MQRKAWRKSTRERNQTISRLAVEFASVFAVALVMAALVTRLWNVIGQPEVTVGWERSFVLAILFGVIQAWAKAREIQSYSVNDISAPRW